MKKLDFAIYLLQVFDTLISKYNLEVKISRQISDIDESTIIYNDKVGIEFVRNLREGILYVALLKIENKKIPFWEGDRIINLFIYLEVLGLESEFPKVEKWDDSSQKYFIKEVFKMVIKHEHALFVSELRKFDFAVRERDKELEKGISLSDEQSERIERIVKLTTKNK